MDVAEVAGGKRRPLAERADVRRAERVAALGGDTRPPVQDRGDVKNDFMPGDRQRARREENREERGKAGEQKIAHMLPLPFLLHWARSASVVLFSSIAPGRSVASPRANAARNDREQAWSRWLRLVMVAGKPCAARAARDGNHDPYS